MQGMPGPAALFTRELADLCGRLAPACSPQVADRIHAVRGALGEPARLVVLGPSGAGKSTLVNALLGRRIARSDDTVPSTLTAVYRHGATERAQLITHDGRRADLPLTATGELPTEIGRPAAEVWSLDIQVTVPALQNLIVVDTPGPGRRTPAEPDASAGPVPEDLDYGAIAALAEADAVLCVYRNPVRRDQQAEIDTAEAVLGRHGNGRGSTLGILTGIDRLGGNTWRLVEHVGERQAALLGHTMLDVLPVAGLLAQAASCDIDQSQFAALQHAASLRPADDSRQVTPPPAPSGIATRTWNRLLDQMGDYGVALAVTTLIRTPHLTRAGLAAVLHSASGLQRVRDCLHTHVVLRRDELKRRRATSQLEHIASNAPAADRELLHDHLENLLRKSRW